jgi:hypothetical protein
MASSSSPRRLDLRPSRKVTTGYTFKAGSISVAAVGSLYLTLAHTGTAADRPRPPRNRPQLRGIRANGAITGIPAAYLTEPGRRPSTRGAPATRAHPW